MTNQTPVELLGHESPDTAYEVADYPYGFRLRTTIRYWVETKKGHGQRLVSQTRNPKKPGQPWNAPKGSTYSEILALHLDQATGHIEHTTATSYNTEAELLAFAARFPHTCALERNRRTLEILIARQRAHARVSWSVTSGPTDSDVKRQTPEEQIAILRRLTVEELSKLRTNGQE